eukprot:scaffold4825_cov38-Tisochrysis_lutea.AAC.2
MCILGTSKPENRKRAKDWLTWSLRRRRRRRSPHHRAMPPTPLFWALSATALVSVLVQCRPSAADFLTEVEYRRQVRSDIKAGRRPRARPVAAAQPSGGEEEGGPRRSPVAPPLFRMHQWADGSWALDAAIVSVGCTRRGCLIGLACLWWRLPSWPMEWDVYMLGAIHAYSTFCSNEIYFRNFAPRLRAPHSILLGSVATRSMWELLWVGSTLLGLGSDLQRAVGRFGFIGLYLGAGISASLVSALYRRSAHGHGGVLALCAYHTFMAPNARHNIMGVELGAKSALAVQLALACSGAFQGDAPLPVFASNLAPCLVAIAAYCLVRLRLIPRLAANFL